MRLKVCLAGALLVVFSFAAVAADQADAKKKPSMDQAMMEAMMKAGTPGAAHKKLDGMVGTWTTKATFWHSPEADPTTMDGTSENKWVMGGRYLEQRFTGSFMGMPFEGVGYTGYDNVKKQYWGTWMDNMSTSMMMTTGSIEADGKTWKFRGMMTDPMTGQDSPIEEKVVVKDNDHHSFEMWGLGPDGMFKPMEMQFTRKK